MKREDVILISKFFVEFPGTIYSFTEFEEEFNFNEDYVKKILEILKKLKGIRKFMVIPWNPEEEDAMTKFKKRAGISGRSFDQARGEANTNGILVFLNRKVLGEINKKTALVTDALLRAAMYSVKPRFDAGKSSIIWGSKICKVPPSSNQFYFCRTIFKRPIGIFTIEQDIADIISPPDGVGIGRRTVFDAMVRLNRLTEEKFGAKIFEHDNNRFRVRAV